MKGKPRLDPALCSYGAATPAIQEILRTWIDVDWFVPPPSASPPEHLAREHHALARARLPEIYAERLAIQVKRGNWSDFLALAADVRARRGWDWKYDALKKLSREHAGARHWSPDALAKPLGEGAPRPEDFFLRLEKSVSWNAPVPELALREVFARADAEVAEWYVTYAAMDTLDAIIWQLAEDSSLLDGNPFVPIVQCYASGYLPFGLDPDQLLLFAFEPDA